ncbi:MAG: thermonuclease family protein [Rhodocyclales bacterium]|nr:thermonuclease family protein [Rhodocyclales bacterium]
MVRFLVVLGLLLQAEQILADTITGRVVGVSDGDTITVLDSDKVRHKVRLAGIDAPESKQAFGQASKKHLSDLVFDRDVTLDCGKVDKYRREVCVVFVDSQDANLAQVKAGMGWWYRKYQKEQTVQQRAEYEAAEAAAIKGMVGLWQETDPIAPWEWRKAKR